MARWNSCNLLYVAPDGKRLWQFDAKGGSFIPGRDLRPPAGQALPAKVVAKNWSHLWQPKLNIAWLPPEEVFLRVIELPAASPEETAAMVEMQLEKISPLPVNQVVWTMQGFPRSGATDNLQTVVAILVPRQVVEEFLGKLEADGFQPDRLEVALLDQLETVDTAGTTNDAWVFPQSLGGQNAALVAWWANGILRNLSLVALPGTGDPAKELRQQISLIAWSGELEGWLTGPARWHLVADPVNAAQWEAPLQAATGETIHTAPPLPTHELALRTAKRAAVSTSIGLLPPEHSARHRQSFVDRLWLHGLLYLALAYLAGLAVYFSCVGWQDYQTEGVEAKVRGLAQSYTNSLEVRARYLVLQDRDNLKFAALDCWRLVAEKLPEGLTIQRFAFADGQTLSLSGNVPAAEVQKIIDFEKTLRKATLNGKPVFNPVSRSANQLSWNEHGDADYWRFGLDLAQTVEETK